jgi:hypothetical protein
MNRRRALTTFAIAAVPFLRPCRGADLDDAGARAAAELAVKSDGSGVGTQCLKTRRREEFEESLFNLRRQMVRDGKLNEELYIYEVVDIGCYQVKGDSLMAQVIDHPGTFGYVAVNRVTGKTYRLWSAPDARKDFNRLIADLDVHIRGQNEAMSVATVYREMALGPREGNVVYGSFQMKQLAEQSFYEAYIHVNWSKRFGTWWRRFQTSKPIDFDVVARRTPKGWIVTGRSFEGFGLTIPRSRISGRPVVAEWSALVSAQGEVVELTPRILFE